MSARDAIVRDLRRRRPKRRLLRVTLVVWSAITAAVWLGGRFHFDDVLSDRSRRNLSRFLDEVRPEPLRDREWDTGVALRWLSDTVAPHAPEAFGATFALSVAAIVLAATAAFVLSFAVARNVNTATSFVDSPRPPHRARRVWAKSSRNAARLGLIVGRAVPEVVWAFLFLSMWGVGPWPAVLALAVHNGGILGRLFGEVTENMSPIAPATLRAIGASRAQLVVAAIVPRNLNRWLLYVFYRWETCVREATVLGLLGFVSLGWFIQDARAGVRYDEMVVYVAMGSGLILLGDIVSGRVRRSIRAGHLTDARFARRHI